MNIADSLGLWEGVCDCLLASFIFLMPSLQKFLASSLYETSSHIVMVGMHRLPCMAEEFKVSIFLSNDFCFFSGMFMRTTNAAHPLAEFIAVPIPQSSAAAWISLIEALHTASVPQSNLSESDTYFLQEIPCLYHTRVELWVSLRTRFFEDGHSAEEVPEGFLLPKFHHAS